MNNLNLNRNLCTQCLVCIKDCPAVSIGRNEEGYPEIINDKCIKCQHCFAVCPEGAISIFNLNPEDSITLKQGSFPSPRQMEYLIKGRRSVRSYLKEDIPEDEINKLLDLAYHAPTGVNRQEISFKVIYERKEMDIFKNRFYSILEKTIENDVTEKYPDIAKILKRYTEEHRDIFFRGAPHILFAAGNEESQLVRTDGVIAASYFELAAASFGYGAVWNGYVTKAVNAIPELKDMLKLKTGEILCYTVCFGIPAVSYARTVQRGKAAVQKLILSDE